MRPRFSVFLFALVFAVPALAGDAVVEIGGFAAPESVLHDTDADVYLVSNVNGAPLAHDGNGFVSRVSPGGKVIELKWIDGAADGVTLNAPKGSAIVADTFWVADIDTLRSFDRESGKPIRSIPIDGATFLNDVAAAKDGSIWVTDTGMGMKNGQFAPTGVDAVYRVTGDGEVEKVIGGDEFQRPNGVVALPDGGFAVNSYGEGKLALFSKDGKKETELAIPTGGLDGLVRLADGSFLVSSWGGKAVYHAGSGVAAKPLIEGISSPADFGFDSKRSRILLPVMGEDRIAIYSFGG